MRRTAEREYADRDECPDLQRHTDGPNGYLAWHEWAGRMHRSGARQSRCPGCGLYLIWTGGHRDLR